MFSKQIYPKLKNGNYNARQKKASLHTQSVYDEASFYFYFVIYVKDEGKKVNDDC